MSEGKCPKCGSTQIIEVGASRFMCQDCYEVFDREKKVEKQPPHRIAITGGKLKMCPYCLKQKPREEFREGLCADCYPEYVKQSKQWEDEALARKIKEEERERKREIFSRPGMPAKQWPPEPLWKPIRRVFLIRLSFAIIFIAVGLIAFFIFKGC